VIEVESYFFRVSHSGFSLKLQPGPATVLVD